MRFAVGLQITNGTAKLIDFLKQAFGAEEIARSADAEGVMCHAVVSVGDSSDGTGEAHAAWQPMPTMFYPYVEDADALSKGALQTGATST